MSDVNISELNSDETGIEYIKTVRLIEELEKKKKDLRKRVLFFHEEGFDLKSVGVTVVKQFNTDLTKSKEAWLKSGMELPTKIIPEQEVFDYTKFKAMLNFDENKAFKMGSISYQVRTKKGK